MRDLGFGTAYETTILKNLLTNLIRKYGITRVLEYPTTTLLDDFEYEGTAAPSAPAETKSSLVWNFCQFEHAQDSARFIDEISSKTDKYVMIIIQNNRNIGIVLHWIYHKIIGREWDHGKIGKMSPNKLREAIAEKALVMREDGFHDVPWFVIDVYESGNFLRKLVPSSLLRKEEIRPSRLENLPRLVKSFLAHHYHVLVEKEAGADGDQPFEVS